MRGLSLKFYILSIGVGSILFVGVVAIVSIFMLNRQITNYEALIEKEMGTAFASERVLLDFKQQINEWSNVLLRGQNPSDSQEYWSRFNRLHSEIQENASNLLNAYIPDKAKENLRAFKRLHMDSLQQYQQAKSAFEKAGYDHTVGDKSVRGLEREPARLLEETAKLIEGQAKKDVHILKEKTDSLTTTVDAFILVVMLAVMGLSYYVSEYRVTRPVRKLVAAIHDLEHGEFGKEISITGDDEMGHMGSALRNLQHKFRKFTDKLREVTEELKATDSHMSVVSKDIQDGTVAQHSRTDQAASAMTELSSTAREVAQHAAEAAAASDKAEEAANDGERVMLEAIETMRVMKEQVSSTVVVISSLEENSKSVGKVLDVIRGIAEQTNLLALNAAIEAARAGEQGRGFAVVADEVRTLAQRTAESTAEIHQIIASVQSGAQEAVSAIEMGAEKSVASMASLDQAGASLNDIRKCVDDIAGVNQLIATAAQEQAHVSEDITQAIAEIADVASSSADQAGDVSIAAAKMGDISQNLENVVNQLSRA